MARSFGWAPCLSPVPRAGHLYPVCLPACLVVVVAEVMWLVEVVRLGERAGRFAWRRRVREEAVEGCVAEVIAGLSRRASGRRGRVGCVGRGEGAEGGRGVLC